MVFFSFGISVFCQERNFSESSLLEPVEKIESLDGKTCIILESDYSGAEVSINGVFQGYTPLFVYELVPGVYNISLEKKGFDKRNFSVEVKSNYVFKYFVNLDKSEVDSIAEKESGESERALNEEDFSFDDFFLYASTFSGLGIGSVPVLHKAAGKFLLPFMTMGASFCTGNSSERSVFGGLFFRGGAAFSFLDNLELCFSGTMFSEEYSVFQFNADVKYSTSIDLADNRSFSFGAKARYGYSSEQYASLGVDKGTGLGLGALCAFDLWKCNLSLAEEYIFSSACGDFVTKGDIFKSGLAFSVRATEKLRIGTWGALNCSLRDGSSDWKSSFFKAIETGLGIYLIPFDAPFIISVNFDILAFVQDLHFDYYTGELGFSYLF